MKKTTLNYNSLAKKIARTLFTDGSAIHATRLELKIGVVGHEKSLGGWCEKAAADQIAVILEKHFKPVGP